MQVLKILLDNPATQLGPLDAKGHTPLWDAMVEVSCCLLALQVGGLFEGTYCWTHFSLHAGRRPSRGHAALTGRSSTT